MAILEFHGARIGDEDQNMQITRVVLADLDKAARRGQAMEAHGYDAVCTVEGTTDQFLTHVLLAQATERVELEALTNPFAHSPMSLARTANDLQQFSAGRFVLGLGLQDRAQVERHFGMPWSHPARRVRDFILAMRAIWASWHSGTRLEYEGEFYRHTLGHNFVTSSTANDHGPPRVHLAATGPRVSEVAGEVADGLIVNAGMTDTYLREINLPAVERGLARSGRRRDDFEIVYAVWLVTGSTPQHLEMAADYTRRALAEWASEPAFNPVLHHSGMADLQEELRALRQRGEVDAMTRLIDDDVLDAFAVVAPPEEVAPRLHARYGDVIDRLWLHASVRDDPDAWTTVVEGLRALPPRQPRTCP